MKKLLQKSYFILGCLFFLVAHDIAAKCSGPNDPSCDTYDTTTVASCDSYTWNGNTYTTSGTYTYTSLNASGCTNTSTLNLTVHYGTQSIISFNSCGPYTWKGTTYTNTGVYTYTSINAQGCVDVMTLNLTVSPPIPSFIISFTPVLIGTCDIHKNIEFNPYSLGGCYQVFRTCWPPTMDPLPLLNRDISTDSVLNTFKIIDNCHGGCVLFDSFKVSHSNTGTVKHQIQSSCDSYTWSKNGTTYTSSGIYTYSTTSGGCKEDYTLNLTINYGTTHSNSVTTCSSYTWPVNGVTYSTSGTYTQTSLNASGCSHTEILILTINTGGTTTSITASDCTSYTWAANGITYTTSGTYTFTSLNASGCTNIDTLNLTINSNCNSIFVPTLSEWGLIILFLLSLSLGMIFLYRKERTLAFANCNQKDNQMPLLDKELFTKVLLALIVVVITASAFIYKLNGSISSTDIIGSFVASFIVAFMIQLFILMKRFEKME